MEPVEEQSENEVAAEQKQATEGYQRKKAVDEQLERERGRDQISGCRQERFIICKAKNGAWENYCGRQHRQGK